MITTSKKPRPGVCHVNVLQPVTIQKPGGGRLFYGVGLALVDEDVAHDWIARGIAKAWPSNLEAEATPVPSHADGEE